MIKDLSNRKFGIEIETNRSKSINCVVSLIDIYFKSKNINYEIKKANNWIKTEYNNAYWHVKRDNSCSDENYNFGIEIASPPCTKDNLNEISGLVDYLNNHLTVNENCGFHIHVDAIDLSKKDIGKIILRWIKIEKFLFNMLPLHRRSNYFCKPYYDTSEYRIMKNNVVSTVPINAYYIFNPWELLTPFDKVFFRRRSLNFVNYFSGPKDKASKKTLELRVPEGTLDSYEIVNWIRFILNFIDYSVRNNSVSNTKDVIQLDEFLRIIGLAGKISKPLKETKKWILYRLNKFN